MKSDLVEVTVLVITETAKALLVSDTGDREGAVWVPKSQIEIEATDREGAYVITLPEWLAIEKGFI
jgi:hypothetical protein